MPSDLIQELEDCCVHCPRMRLSEIHYYRRTNGGGSRETSPGSVLRLPAVGTHLGRLPGMLSQLNFL